MSERDTFGPRLRSERERRGISLETIAEVTKVGGDLWQGLERNDFSRWPSGIFARAFVREYARVVGLDVDEVVDEFCRSFPQGDRRATRLIKAQAEFLGQSPAAPEDPAPAQGERRSSEGERRAEARARYIRLAPRTVAAAIDVTGTLSLAAAGPLLLGTGFWTSAGVAAILYFSVSTIASGRTPGSHAVDALRQRMPALFTVPEHRAHA